MLCISLIAYTTTNDFGVVVEVLVEAGLVETFFYLSRWRANYFRFIDSKELGEAVRLSVELAR